MLMSRLTMILSILAAIAAICAYRFHSPELGIVACIMVMGVCETILVRYRNE